jgi:hypothetical protein
VTENALVRGDTVATLCRRTESLAVRPVNKSHCDRAGGHSPGVGGHHHRQLGSVMQHCISVLATHWRRANREVLARRSDVSDMATTLSRSRAAMHSSCGAPAGRDAPHNSSSSVGHTSTTSAAVHEALMFGMWSDRTSVCECVCVNVCECGARETQRHEGANAWRCQQVRCSALVHECMHGGISPQWRWQCCLSECCTDGCCRDDNDRAHTPRCHCRSQSRGVHSVFVDTLCRLCRCGAQLSVHNEAVPGGNSNTASTRLHGNKDSSR